MDKPAFVCGLPKYPVASAFTITSKIVIALLLGLPPVTAKPIRPDNPRPRPSTAEFLVAL